MTQLRDTFDAESLGALEGVLDEVSRELAGDHAASEGGKPVITREQLARIVLRYAQDGESDPVRLRRLVLKGLGRE